MGHRRGQGGAREARSQSADRHVYWRRDSRRRVQELSHEHAQRLQPSNQLRHQGQPVGVAERGQTETSR